MSTQQVCSGCTTRRGNDASDTDSSDRFHRSGVLVERHRCTTVGVDVHVLGLRSSVLTALDVVGQDNDTVDEEES